MIMGYAYGPFSSKSTILSIGWALVPLKLNIP